MSAFSGLIALRSYSKKRPELLLEDIIDALKHISPDDGYHDYDSALVLHGWIGPTMDHTNIQAFFRHVITILIQRTAPWWHRLFILGRDRVKSALSSNEAQCFEAAGLFSESPNTEIYSWWDMHQEEARSENDAKRLAQGREAERLTIDFEVKRLSEQGIKNRPRWVALEDNTAGYDVHSFDKGPSEPIARLIEVKSCSGGSQEIFLTRNEWNTALEMSPNYLFHIWALPDEHLVELRPEEIEKHIPIDRGGGSWQVVRIVLDCS